MKMLLQAGMLGRWPLYAAAALLVACSDGSGPSSNACPQTFEFGNFGCARVAGVVRDATGNPVAGARVALSVPEGSQNTFDNASQDTGPTGAYSLEIHDFDSQGPPADPVPMYLHAFRLADAGTEPTGDSILVEMNFAPVGELPEVLQADITID